MKYEHTHNNFSANEPAHKKRVKIKTLAGAK